MFPFLVSFFLSLLSYANRFSPFVLRRVSRVARYHTAVIIERPRKVAGFEYQMRREEHARPVHARVHCDECKFSMNDGRFDREDTHRKQIPHSRFSRSSRTAANNARKRNTPDTSVSVLRVFSLVFCFCFSLLFLFFYLGSLVTRFSCLLYLLIYYYLCVIFFLSFCLPFKSLSPATLNTNFYMTEHRLMLYLLSWSTLLMLSTLRSLSVSLKPCLLRCCCFISIIVAAAAAAFFFFFFFFFRFV